MISGLGFQPTRIFRGRLYGRISVVAWSTNLQSSWGVSNALRKEIARTVESSA